MATLWIGQDYLMKRSVIDSDVEYSKITPVIELVQDKYVLPILGTSLYNTLNGYIEAKISNGTTIPAIYKTLLDDYILKMLVHYILYESSPTFKFRYANKGIVVKDSDNSQPAGTNDLEFLMNIWKTNGEMYANRLMVYLRANAVNYPTYYTNVYGAVFPKGESYETDLYLGNGRPNPHTNDADF